MNITEEEKKEYEELYQYYLNHPLILKMKDFQMHRGSNCYVHSFRVCKLCVKKMVKRKGYNIRNVIIAAVLHDYYLYDWREHHELKKKHGRRHPLVACANAVRDFNISQEVQDIIKSHMWPLTPKYFPKTKEARLVNRMDNHIATKEGLTFRSYKKKRMDKYMKSIAHLFDE